MLMLMLNYINNNNQMSNDDNINSDKVDNFKRDYLFGPPVFSPT